MRFLYYPIIAALLFSIGCGSEKKDGGVKEKEAPVCAAEESEEAKQEKTQVNSVSLWSAGIRSKPGRNVKDAKYITSLVFGEQVTETGDTVYIKDEDRVYTKVKLSDGKEGWTYRYLLASGAKIAAVTNTIFVCKRPDITTISDKKFDRLQVIAISNEPKNNWYEAWSKEKTVSGWIKGDNYLSTNDVDVALALQYQKAMAEKDEDKRLEKLKAITDNSAFRSSKLFGDVEEMIDEAEENSIEEEMMYEEETDTEEETEEVISE